MSLADGMLATVSLAMIEQPPAEHSTAEGSNIAKNSSGAALSLKSAANGAMDIPALELNNFEQFATKAVLSGIRMTDAERRYLKSLVPAASLASSSGKATVAGTCVDATTTPCIDRKQVRGNNDYKTEQPFEGALWNDFELFVQHIFGSDQVPHD